MRRMQRIGSGVGVLALAAGAVLASGGTAGADGREGGRIAGADRIATSVEVSERAFADGAATAYLASARVPFDAQVGATLGGPILLVEPCGPINPRVLDELDRLGATRVDVLGGPAAVADSVHQQALDGTYDGTVDDCPGAIPSSRDGINLSVREVDGQYALDVTNVRDGDVTGGVGYVLERLVGVAYVQINEGAVFTAQGIIIEPGQTVEVTRVDPERAETMDGEAGGELGPIGPGTYRVRTSVFPDEGGAPDNQIEVAGTFTIAV